MRREFKTPTSVDEAVELLKSHGANARSTTRSRFHLEHDWTGTRDPSAWLAVPRALDEMATDVIELRP